MKQLVIVVLCSVVGAGTAAAQIIPRLPGTRATPLQPVKRDTTTDTSGVKWPTPDSAARVLLEKKGYSITRYQGDTAYFDAEHHVIDLLAAKKRRAIVDRDSQVVVSDSGIYYTEATRHFVSGGHYILIPPPGSGQANVVGVGRVDYDQPNKTFRLNNARLPINNGEMWYMQAKTLQLVGDSANGKSPTAYLRGGSLTSCDDSIPDYHFEYHDAKRTSGNTLVARPAVLYIKDIPIMWLPFIFTDTHGGRHSGILVPQFGIGDIVRNSPTYRRNIDHAGYYWALNDYMDFGTWLDWRSSAGSRAGDPGWIKYNTDFDYKWLDRFIAGRIGLGWTSQGDGTTNKAISWTHTQDFSHDSHINTNFNYVTNTTVQRQNTFNPYSALATISSQATYQTKLGPASLSLGATQRQYPGRPQIDRTFPTLSLTSTAIGLGSWLNWTPSFSLSRNDVLHMDQPGLGAYVFDVDPITGTRDSTLSKSRHSAQSSITFDTPLQIFGHDFKNSFHINQQRNDFPQQFQIYDVKTGLVTESRVYAATYRTDVDWTPDVSLTQLPIPFLGQNKFNFSPSVSLQNVDPGPYWVSTERTNGKFVHQTKRFTFGASASPTMYALFRGFGPFSRIRHSISPSISYQYAPSADVSDEYLIALGRTRAGYLGSLRQNQVTFGLNQNFEAKVRPHDDTTGTDKGATIRLLSLNLTPLSYDFERAAHAREQNITSKWAGLTTETWGYNLNSELLPGFDFSSSYSLFQGSTLSDSARFKPFLTSISASFTVGRDQNPWMAFQKLFGKAVPPAQVGNTSATPEQLRQQQDDAQNRALAAQPVAGTSQGSNRFIIPTTQGWRAGFQFSRSSPRPPTGANVIEFDPKTRCQQITGNNPLLLDACLAQQLAQPTVDTPVGSLTAGGPAYHIPPTTSLNSNVSFNLTPKWAAAWQTTYDLELHQFASHIVSLQRDIHDWRAMFGFTQSSNGNFAFNFSIALKAEPDLKFDYNRSTVRSGIAPF